MIKRPIITTFVSISMLTGTALATPQDSPEWRAEVIQAHLDKIVSWQNSKLEKSIEKPNVDWLHGAMYAGIAAYGNMNPQNPGFDMIRRTGEAKQWGHNSLWWHADEHCIGQGYLEVAMYDKNPLAAAKIKALLDKVMEANFQNPLDFRRDNQKRWNWVDALFMSPTVYTKLYSYTGDEKYLDFIDHEIKATYEYLYNKNENLFYRDSRYFPGSERAKPDEKVFWSRGNGWAFAALAIIMKDYPQDRPAYQFYKEIFQKMAVAIKKAQQPDGSWHPSMLDPKNPDIMEMSATMFLTYGLVWGVNNGILDEKEYMPCVEKAWKSACFSLRPDGALGNVQPVADRPDSYSKDSTTVYGTGAFLLAGTELYKYVVLKDNKKASGKISVVNPISSFRPQETISVTFPATSYSDKVRVFDWRNGRILAHQFVDTDADGKKDALLFQADVGAKATRQFYVFTNSSLPAAPSADVCYARHITERKDDIAWENDLTAYRTYGPMVSQPAPKGEGLISSGIDVWVKRVKEPVLNEFYKRGDYHADHGKGMDFFKVSTGRGCGGVAIINDGKAYTSRNWDKVQVLYTGPIRAAFVIDYAPFDIGGGAKASEKRIVSIDAGSYFFKSESSVTVTGTASSALLGAGLDINKGRKNNGEIMEDAGKGIISIWNPPHGNSGVLARAIVMPNAQPFNEGEETKYLTMPIDTKKPAIWYTGTAWDQAGYIKTAQEWNNTVQNFQRNITAPLRVSTGK